MSEEFGTFRNEHRVCYVDDVLERVKSSVEYTTLA